MSFKTLNVCLYVLKDLTYKHSVRVGDAAARTLYEGTDYQYYFSLPSGDPSDDYKGNFSPSLGQDTHNVRALTTGGHVGALSNYLHRDQKQHIGDGH